MSPLPFFKDATKDFEKRTIDKTALRFISHKKMKMKPGIVYQAAKSTFKSTISNCIGILHQHFSILIITKYIEMKDISGGCGCSVSLKNRSFFGFCGELSTVCCCPAFFYFLDEGGCQMLWGHLLGPPEGEGLAGMQSSLVN